MATVASQLTRIHDVEGALSLTSIGGGAGGSANAEIVIQGAQSAGRKQSNAADHGFWLTVTSRDVSAAGAHVGVWINHVHYGVLTLLRVRLGSVIGSATAGNWDGHDFPLTQYPATGGWVRMWINVARTPEATGDSGALNKSAMVGVAIVASLPAVSGNAPNILLDACDFTTGGLLLTGTAGVWQDFVTADEATGANKYGVVTTKDGVIYCLARLTLGSASLLVFADQDFVVIFPNQSLVATTFMGISVDLQHASTAVSLSNGVIRSAGTTRRGDLVVTGTAGSFSADGITFGGLRIVTLTSACTINGCSISGSGQIAANDATLTNCAISGSLATAALLWDTATDTQGRLNGTTFTSGGTGHGIQFGSNTPAAISLVGISFSGYGADGTTNAAIYNNSGKEITISLVGGSTPTVRNGTGASTILSASVLHTLTGLIEGTEVTYVRVSDGVELFHVESVGAGGTTTYSHSGGETVDILINHLNYDPDVSNIYNLVLPSVDASIPVKQIADPTYANP